MTDTNEPSSPPADASLSERLPKILPMDQGPGSPRRRIQFFGLSFLVLGLVLFLFRGVLLPFLLAVVVAYVLAPIVNRLEKYLPRWAAVVSLYVVLLGLIAAFVAIGVPRLVLEVERLARATPQLVETARDDWIPQAERALREAMSYTAPEATPALPVETPPPEPEPAIRVVPDGEGFAVFLPDGGLSVESERDGSVTITASREREAPPRDVVTTVREAVQHQIENSQEHAVALIKTVQGVIQSVVRGVFNFFIMLMLSAYLLVTTDKIFDFFRSMVKVDKQSQFDRLMARIDHGLSGVVRGQLSIALVNGVLSGIGFYLFDLPYWPILTLIATALSVIPIFGSILSSIPAVLLGLQISVPTAFFVLAWIVGIHQLEANLLNPKIMGDAARVHPVLVVFALLGGEHLFGITGALLAVPILSICQSLFLHYREVALGVPTRKSIPPPA